jgi:hypothetical protein
VPMYVRALVCVPVYGDMHRCLRSSIRFQPFLLAADRSEHMSVEMQLGQLCSAFVVCREEGGAPSRKRRSASVGSGLSRCWAAAAAADDDVINRMRSCQIMARNECQLSSAHLLPFLPSLSSSLIA